MESFKMIKFRTKMAVLMKEHGRMEKQMEPESTYIMIQLTIKENFKMT